MTGPDTAGTARPARGVFGGSAWGIGRVAGIDLAIDSSWLLIFLLITLSLGGLFAEEHPSWARLHRWTGALLTSLLFFASILLHELGHSLVALRLGIRVRSITLFIFGGVAQLESEPRRARDEVAVALAGPLVSVALGGLFLLGRGPADTVLGAAFGWLGEINLVLAVFNLLPGFPLDGGRVLRGLIWARTASFERATRIAAASGSAFAFLLIALGIVEALVLRQLLSGLWIAFIGWFLLAAARGTVGQMLLERALAAVPVRATMEPPPMPAFDGRESVADVIEGPVLRHGRRTLFVVDAQGRLRGLATLRELGAVPAGSRVTTRLESAMIPLERLAVIDPAENGWTAFRRMAEHGVNQLPVVSGRRLLGVVTRERLMALVHAHTALSAADPDTVRASGSRG